MLGLRRRVSLASPDERMGVIEDFADVVVGGTPSTKEPTYWGGNIVWATPTDITGTHAVELHDSGRRITPAGVAASSAQVVPAGSVLVTTRATIGPAVVAGCDMATNQGVTALVPKDGVDSTWLYYWVLANRHEFIVRGAGNTFPEISRKKTRAIPMRVPPPREQRRVADVLSSVTSAIACRREYLDRAEVALRALLAHTYKVAGEMGETKLGSVATARSGISWTKDDETEPSYPGARASVGVAHVQREAVTIAGVDCTYLAPSPKVEKGLIGPDSLLMIRTNGNPARIGNVHRTPDEAVGRVLSSFLMCITPEHPRDVGFLLRMLQSPQAQASITAATSGSTGLRNIAVTWVRGLPLPWPQDASDRENLCAPLDALVHLIQVARTELERATTLRRAVLAELFHGSHAIPETYDLLLDSEPVTAELALA